MRAIILSKLLKDKGFDVVICENEIDSYVFTKNLNCLKIYDCPTPWSDELFYGGELSRNSYLKLVKIIHEKT